MKDSLPFDVLVIGAGPAGLSSAHQLLTHDLCPLVLELDPTYVGGLARTVLFKGNRFDIGGHRFFTRSSRVQSFWSDILGEEMLRRPRSSRIMYRGVYLAYPLQLKDTVDKLGTGFLLTAVGSWCWAQLFGPRQDRNFEEWIVRRFGRKIFTSFFKSYTEKVWGIPCDAISSDWAAQRINSLSIPTLVKSLFRSDRAPIAKTLIDEFEYPRLGPGQLWERVSDEVCAGGGQVLLDQRVVQIRKDASSYCVVTRSSSGVCSSFRSESIISTMPLRELCAVLDPAPPREVLEAAAQLRYRDFIAVALVLDCPSPFCDQWLYVHEHSVKVGRVQNMANWSEALVADKNTTVLLFEYFCSSSAGGDDLWNESDESILELATQELALLALAPGARLLDSRVLRAPKAYPLYDASYQQHVRKIRSYLADEHPQLHTIGRNGMHRYNNQDHAILCGFIAADAVAGVKSSECAWSINQDAQHIEERLIPQTVVATDN